MIKKYLSQGVYAELERYNQEVKDLKTEVWEKEQEFLTDEYNFMVEMINRLIDSRDSYWKCQRRLINPDQIEKLYGNIIALMEVRLKKIDGRLVEYKKLTPRRGSLHQEVRK